MTIETTESPSALVPVEATLPTDEFDALESLIRLIVGGGIEAPAELVARLKQWEAQVAATGTPESLAPMPPATDPLRYALVGLAFATHDQVRSGASRFGRLMNASAGRLWRTAQPVTESSLMQPVQRLYKDLVAEGETAVNRWIERGQAEEPRSRLIARQAVNLTVDEIIQHLAENPEVKELVTQQTAGIADDIVGGVRGRTVTADIVLERLVRGLLRRPPREQLPPPAPEVMAQADRVSFMDEE
ncbi:MAG TPA: hypothetical protein PLD25_26670 [Chloroflexota bacterium]|nr:hypothetical protein [Chloroflexota bacterium]